MIYVIATTPMKPECREDRSAKLIDQEIMHTLVLGPPCGRHFGLPAVVHELLLLRSSRASPSFATPATAHSYADRGGILILIGALHRGRLHDDDSTSLGDPVREATATARTVDADLCRIETRAAMVSTAIAWPQSD